jgi:hypothetical protein
MLFGIDFDGTWTRDPALFHAFVQLLRTAGHDAILVTMRYDRGHEARQVQSVMRGLLPIVFTGRRAKRPVVVALGYQVDVWIDDMPHFVDTGASS